MTPEVITACISLLGTAIGTLGGILATSKLTDFRLKSLEEEVKKHNTLIDRMYKVETRVTVLEDDFNKLKKD